MDLKELFAGMLNLPIEEITENTGPATTMNWKAWCICNWLPVWKIFMELNLLIMK